MEEKRKEDKEKVGDVQSPICCPEESNKTQVFQPNFSLLTIIQQLMNCPSSTDVPWCFPASPSIIPP